MRYLTIIEIWCTLGGQPIFARGPFPGSQNDARSYHGGAYETQSAATVQAVREGRDPGWAARQLFPHYKKELFLGDKGYVGCAHILHEYKKPVGKNLSTQQRRWNRRFRLVRSRVERLFAWMDRFHILRFCDGGAQHLRDAVIIILGVFHFLNETSVYDDVVAMSAEEIRSTFADDKEKLLPCRCTRGDEVVESTEQFRETLREEWEEKGVTYDPKPPQKRRRSP